MSVPYSFTPKEVSDGRKLLIERIGRAKVRKDGSFSGDPFVTYEELVSNAGYHIEDEYDGVRAGNLAGEISKLEHDSGGPLLSATVVHADSKIPGHGFFALAGALGMLPAKSRYDVEGTAEMAFHTDQVRACVLKYGRK